MESIELRELDYFVVLAEELDLGRAATRLYLDRSGLSRAIRRIEAELDVSLFSRADGRLTLTLAGASLLARAEEVRRAFGRVQEGAEAAHRGTAGKLALASCPASRYELVPPILERFAGAFPAVHVVRREQLAADIVDDLLERRIDVAIAACVPFVPNLERHALREMELRALLASSHPLADRQRVGLGELREEAFLISPREHLAGGEDCLQPVFEAAGFEPRYVTDAVDYDEDLHAVRRREGVLLSARTFPGGLPPGVASLGLEPRSTLAVELLWRQEDASATLACFLRSVHGTAASLGWSEN